MLWQLQIICILKRDNKYKKGWIDRWMDIKKGKKCFVELIAKIEKAEVFKKKYAAHLYFK